LPAINLRIVLLRQAGRLEIDCGGVFVREEALERVARGVFAGDVVEIGEVHLRHLGGDGVRDARHEDGRGHRDCEKTSNHFGIHVFARVPAILSLLPGRAGRYLLAHR
jgi:hypothetical protein